MVEIPSEYHELFEKKAFANVATMSPESTPPNMTLVWIDYDEESDHLLVDTDRGRQKERNANRGPAVGGSVKDPDDRYRHLSVMGEVEEVSTDGARDQIGELAKRYTEHDEYQSPIRTERVIIPNPPGTGHLVGRRLTDRCRCDRRRRTHGPSGRLEPHAGPKCGDSSRPGSKSKGLCGPLAHGGA